MDMRITPSAAPPTEALTRRLGAQYMALQGNADVQPEQLREMANDFEAVLVGKLMDEMKRTVNESALFESPASRQINDMFWSYLSEEVGRSGSLGLADQLYQDFCRQAGVDPSTAATPQQAIRLYRQPSAETAGTLESEQ
jgi:Rod binding domain-containing protein